MITVYKKNAIPKTMTLEANNDIFFNKNTSELLDERAKQIIKQIDSSELSGKYAIKSRFNGMLLNIDKLSTGCKTVLNILYNPDRVFDIRECGENALDVLYTLPCGNVYCDYPLISFDMERAEVCDKAGKREICSYDELKEWWMSED